MSRLLALTALAAVLLASPAIAQTMASPPAKASPMKPMHAKKHGAMMMSGSSMMSHKSSKAGDNSADDLNQQELKRLSQK